MDFRESHVWLGAYAGTDRGNSYAPTGVAVAYLSVGLGRGVVTSFLTSWYFWIGIQGLLLKNEIERGWGRARWKSWWHHELFGAEMTANGYAWALRLFGNGLVSLYFEEAFIWWNSKCSSWVSKNCCFVDELRASRIDEVQNKRLHFSELFFSRQVPSYEFFPTSINNLWYPFLSLRNNQGPLSFSPTVVCFVHSGSWASERPFSEWNFISLGLRLNLIEHRFLLKSIDGIWGRN